jgi:hypothetical protein
MLLDAFIWWTSQALMTRTTPLFLTFCLQIYKIHQSKNNLHSFYLFHVLFSKSITYSARNVHYKKIRNWYVHHRRRFSDHFFCGGSVPKLEYDILRRNASTNVRKKLLDWKVHITLKPKHTIYVRYFSILLYLLNVQINSFSKAKINLIKQIFV